MACTAFLIEIGTEILTAFKSIVLSIRKPEKKDKIR